MATKYTNDIKMLALEKYYKGQHPVEISREMGINKGTIWTWIYNPAPIQREPSTFWTKEEEEFLKQHYSSMSKDEILEYLPDKTRKVLTYKVESMGLRKPPVRSVLDFSCIDSEEKAYIVGFLAADGCISKPKKRNYRISLEISTKDEEHLCLIRDLLAPNAKISYRKSRDMCSFSFVDPQMTRCLFELGVVPNKTSCIQPPTKISDNYLRHYIRGYLDGDGCIRVNSNKLVCIFVGQEQLLSFINNKFSQLYKHNCNIRKGKGNFSYLEYGHLTAYRFCEWVYNESKIHLDRKYRIFEKWRLNRNECVH